MDGSGSISVWIVFCSVVTVVGMIRVDLFVGFAESSSKVSGGSGG